MKSAVRALLLCFARAAYEHVPVPPDVDWTAVRSEAWLHGLTPLACHFLRRQHDVTPATFKALIERDRLALAVQVIRLTHQLRVVLQELSLAGVPVIVLKGPALAETLYPEPTLRPFGDLDLLSHEQDWLAVHRTLLRLGYVPALPLHSPPPKVWDRKAYYHLQYRKHPDGTAIEVHFDVWQIGLRPKLGDRFWERSVPVTIAGIPARILSVEDQLLHLCVHLHHHSYARLIWFTDLALLLRRYADKIDWSYVITSARTEAVEVSLYYSLVYTERLLGVGAPSAVLRAVQPSPLRAWVHDLLWPPRRVLQLDGREGVSFQFDEVPAGPELVINLLLMGRIREKLVYLLRLLAPPSSWLAYYYNTDNPATLRHRRIVHAPKLVLVAIANIWRSASHVVARRLSDMATKGQTS